MAARRFEGRRLVVASHNEGKVGEIRELLAPFGVETVSAAEIDLPVPEETEDSFHGNARIKAHAAASAAGIPALADDSGLSVDALDGEPGVYTADWAETPEGRDFGMAMQKVQTLLDDKQAPEPRTAQFNCVLCLAWPDGHDECFHGIAPGRVTWPPRGEHGHGYDPVFIPDGETRTFAELTPPEKNGYSHRGHAFRQLVDACFAKE